MALLGGGGCCTAPFVEGRAFPLGFAVISGRIWFVGRATVTVPPLADLAECFALLGGFFADMDGEGDEVLARPLVWIPAGVGRFVLGCGGMMGGGMGVVLGAMATVGIGGVKVLVIDGWPGGVCRSRAGG